MPPWTLFVVCFLIPVSREDAIRRVDLHHRTNRSKRITDNWDYEELRTVPYARMAGKWPWVVRLQFSRYPRTHRCGGALISRNVVLTAAHCVNGYKSTEITVHASDVHTLLRDENERVVGVKEVIIHRYYHQSLAHLDYCARSPETVAMCVNDVALLVLDGLVNCQYMILLPWSQTIVSVLSRRFPTPIDPKEWKDCHVAGWGFTSIFGPNSEILRDADVSLIDLRQCNSTCRYGGELLPGMICAAGDGERGQDACMGDSGGPLMCKKDNVWRLVGIVSWGFGCGDPSKPGVYADVGYYQEWIMSQFISRPRLEAQFWNTMLECKSSWVRIRECYDPWSWQLLRLAGIRCPY